MSKRITVTLKPETYELLKKLAKQNYRTVSNQADKFIKEGLKRNGLS